MKVELQPSEIEFLNNLINKTGSKWDGIVVSFRIYRTLVILDFDFKYLLKPEEQDIVRGIYDRKELKSNKLAIKVNQKEQLMEVIETW